MASTTFSGPVTSTNGFISGSGSVVTLSSDTSLTSGSHAGRVLLLDKADGLTVTLPSASGSGNVYKFFVKETITSNNYVIQLSGSDTMSGVAVVANDDNDSANIFQTASAGSSTITLDGSTKGGILGGMV